MRGSCAVLYAVVFLVCSGIFLWWLNQFGIGLEFKFPEEKILYSQVSYQTLDGWQLDDHKQGLAAFLQSCKQIKKWPPQRFLSSRDKVAGRARDWLSVCSSAERVGVEDSAKARRFFEEHFQPIAINRDHTAMGLFTGYYEPLLQGSRKLIGAFSVPLYARPKNIISVDLGDFNDSLKGNHVLGLLQGQKLRPYYDRKDIVDGALKGKGLEIVYVNSALDAFFLQIQGSGRVNLRDGTQIHLGYGGGNGWGYFAIGRELIKRGVLTKESVSMQSIRSWLLSNPEKAKGVMAMNPSYVFFRELRMPGPIGALGVVLSPGRSIAVDKQLIPLGIPIWLEASYPLGNTNKRQNVLRRLMVAQDTGGAIKGSVRGDVFWGHGDHAAAIAGRMKNQGKWFFLLPNILADRL